MNSIQFRIQDAQVLDLFSGSGALGFEALSRGASHCHFVESERAVVALLQKNAHKLGCEERMECWTERSEKALERMLGNGTPLTAFDLIFIDPPYAGGFELPILSLLSEGQLLNPEGLVMFEWGKQKSLPKELPEKSGVLVKIREKEYGDSILTTYQKL
jgi:16S rRNA (guanine(966)-N(2))-methyltransferase RsmD